MTAVAPGQRGRTGAPPLCRMVVEFLLPSGPCALCGADSGSGPVPGICRACWKGRRKPPEPLCPVCGFPFPEGGTAGGDAPCGECLRDPPAYEAHRSSYLYEGPARELLLLYKEGRRYPLAGVLGGALARTVRGAWPEVPFHAVVPVPGSLARRMRRGFDPAVLIGRELARRLGVPFEGGLRMRRSTRPQKSLTAVQRRENLRGAFRLRSRGMKRRNILLVDDISTTGATLREASRVLVRAGAAVWAASVAMTPERELDLQGPPGPEVPAQG